MKKWEFLTNCLAVTRAAISAVAGITAAVAMDFGMVVKVEAPRLLRLA